MSSFISSQLLKCQSLNEHHNLGIRNSSTLDGENRWYSLVDYFSMQCSGMYFHLKFTKRLLTLPAYSGSVNRYGVRPCVRPSVCLSQLQQQSVLQWLHGSLQQRRAPGECGQCHVVSVRR